MKKIKLKEKYQNEIHLRSPFDSVFSIVDDPMNDFSMAFNRQQQRTTNVKQKKSKLFFNRKTKRILLSICEQ